MTIQDVILFDFQVEAVERMVERKKLLLALHMGLGKTLTSIAAIEEMLDGGRLQRGFIIVPASLKYQWQREIKRFTGRRAVVIDGTKALRARQYQWSEHFPYVVTNYESIVNDWEYVKDMHLEFIVLDEATAIKGLRSKRSRRIKFLAKNVPVKYALTGQPVENRPEELFSIMQFVDPEVLGEFSSFDVTFIERDYYGRPKKYRNLNLMKKTLAPAMVRKTRAEVVDQLPDVIDTVIPIVMDRPEAKLYKLIVELLMEKLDQAAASFGGSFDVNVHYNPNLDPAAAMVQGEVMSRMLALRLLCDDPALLIKSGDDYLDETKKSGSAFAGWLRDEGHLDRWIGKEYVSAKRRVIHEELLAALDEDPDNKVVIFSTFKKMLELLKADSPCESVIYNGDMNARQKDAAKEQFKCDKHCRLFLSSDAGGYGVDIPEANFLFSADLPWSTGKKEQRDARIVRISSTWDHVDNRDFIIRGSIEEYISNLLDQKKGIAGAFLDSAYDRQNAFVLNLSTLTEFLSSTEV